MDPNDPRRVSGRPARFAVAVTVVAALLLLVRPVAAADPLLPSLPVALPSVPLPTLPVATPKLPTLPPLPTVLPTITLPPVPTLPPLPTPTLPPPPTPTLPPLPTPTLPVGTPTPKPSSQPVATATLPTTASASPSTSVFGAGPIGSAGTIGVPPQTGPGAATIDPGTVTPTVGIGGSFFDSITLPGLVLGVPAIILVGILATQVAVGAAWLPVIRRWLNRRV